MSQSNSKKNPPQLIKWDVLSPQGPEVSFHIAAIIENKLYIHGGVKEKLAKQPSANLYCFNFDTNIWLELKDPDSPRLSHHACVVVDKQYLVIIGGWDGKVRNHKVVIYDTHAQKWLFPETKGFAKGAGLSSHTATLQSSGDILVIGREGSARTQKRFGNAWTLSGSIAEGVFTYTELAMDVSSRSGHTTDLRNKTLVILGGRDDKLIETHKGFSSSSEPAPEILQALSKRSSSMLPIKPPRHGRRHHVSVCGSDALFMHGGETFDGRSREPAFDMYYIQYRPDVKWSYLGEAPIGRVGHSMTSHRDTLLVHGGRGQKNVIYGDTYIMSVI